MSDTQGAKPSLHTGSPLSPVVHHFNTTGPGSPQTTLRQAHTALFQIHLKRVIELMQKSPEFQLCIESVVSLPTTGNLMTASLSKTHIEGARLFLKLPPCSVCLPIWLLLPGPLTTNNLDNPLKERTEMHLMAHRFVVV